MIFQKQSKSERKINCLLDIFAKANLCIGNSFFPSDLKLDNVTPTSKKKSKTLKTAMQAH